MAPIRKAPKQGFDVVVERSIGHIEFSDTGEMSPIEAAFRLIALEGQDGEYHFPHPDTFNREVERTTPNIHVTVEGLWTPSD